MTRSSGRVLPYVLLAAGCGLSTFYAGLGYVMAGMLSDPSRRDLRAAILWGILALGSGAATIVFAVVAARRRRRAQSRRE